MISHEVRTPLGGVIGMLRSALKEADLPGSTRSKLRLSLSNAEVLLQIINDILDFSRLEAGKMPLEILDFDLGGMLHEVTSLLADRAQAKGIALLTEVDPTLPVWWRGDPTRLRQVVVNLAGNGIKFTEHGEVCVSVAPGEGQALCSLCATPASASRPMCWAACSRNSSKPTPPPRANTAAPVWAWRSARTSLP
jgi:signal transduction histidine kinase